MKRFILLLCVVILLFVLSGCNSEITPAPALTPTPETKSYKESSSPNRIYTLWDIQWGNSPRYVKDKLKEDKGIIVNEDVVDIGIALLYNYFTNDGFSLLNHTANIRYQNIGGNESITLSFTPIDKGSHDDYLNRFYSIVDTYYEKYGLPNTVYLEVYSKGQDAWEDKTCDSIHEVKILDSTPIYSLDIATLASARDYINKDSAVHLYIILNNIEIRTTLNYGENDDNLCIIYKDELDRNKYSEDVYEEYHLTEYSDTGI